MTARSDVKDEVVGNGRANSMAPSVRPGNMMMVGSDDHDDGQEDLLFDDEKHSTVTTVAEVRRIVRRELGKQRLKHG